MRARHLAGPVIAALLGVGCSSSTGGSGDDLAPAANCPTRGVKIEANANGASAGSAEVGSGGEITVYSGRSEKLVGPLIERFERATGIKVNARYGDTAELAATILEEGARSPADVFFAQDAGALGALQAKGRFAPLPRAILDRVPAAFRSGEGRWVGTSGRVRVIAYNCEVVDRNDLPKSVFGLADARWRGKVGWAPTNGSFQIFVTAMRRLEGDAATRRWLEDMKRIDTRVYPNNDAIVEAIAEREIEAGLVNHYYPYEVRAELPDSDVEAFFLPGGDVGGLVNVAGAGILRTSDKSAQAARFIGYLLSVEGQEYFVERTFEYPLVLGLDPFEKLPPLDELQPPAVDLSSLGDLEGTLDLLEEVGLL